MIVRSAALAVAATIAFTATASAQDPGFKPRVQLELRADALGGPPAGAQLGVGANVAADSYVRVGLDVAGGIAAHDGGVAAGRADLVTRYLFDPFKEIAWGPYAGAGLSAQWYDRSGGANWRANLLMVLGVEGPVHAGWRTSVELGLGGGARLGVVLRRARSNGR